MKPSTYRCLKLLRDQESVTTHDFLLAGCGSRFGARLAELRHEHGCVIDEHKLSDRPGSWYRLLSEPAASTSSPAPPAAGDQPAPSLGVPPAARATTSNPCTPDLSSAASACPADSSLLPPAAAFEGLGQANTSRARCAIDDDYDWEDEAA